MSTCFDFAGLIFVHFLVIMTVPYSQLTGQGIETCLGLVSLPIWSWIFFKLLENPFKLFSLKSQKFTIYFVGFFLTTWQRWHYCQWSWWWCHRVVCGQQTTWLCKKKFIFCFTFKFVVFQSSYAIRHFSHLLFNFKLFCLCNQVNGPSYNLLLKKEKSHEMDINSVQWSPSVSFYVSYGVIDTDGYNFDIWWWQLMK